MNILLLSVLLALLGPVQFALADDPSLHAKVQTFYDGVQKVWNTRDYKRIAKRFTDDAALLLQGSPAVQGIENITRFFQQTINFSSLVSLTAIDVEFLHQDAEGNGLVFVRANVTTTPTGSSKQYSSGVVHILTYFDGDFYVSLEGINGYPAPKAPTQRDVNSPVAQMPVRGVFPPDQVRDRIEAANKLWMAAFASGNASAVAQLYTTDATVLPENTFPAVGQAQIAAVFQGAMAAGVATVDLIVEEVGVAPGDSYYFERSNYVFHDKAGAVVDVGKYIVIWRTQPTLKLYIDLFNSDKH